MYLSLVTERAPARDLGFLLHKHPDRVHEKDLGFGRVLMFYPEASDERCRFVLLLDVDPVGLVRGRGRDGGLFDHYVNDRPYAASSLMSVALARCLNTAFAGRSKTHQALAEMAIPLAAEVAPLPARGGADLVGALFAPLGYEVSVTQQALDPVRSASDPAPYVSLKLSGVVRLVDLLSHLYVLMPVLDDDKHYWIGRDELEKLLRKGEGWLADHPERELIARRYLGHRKGLAREAMARLLGREEGAEEAQRESQIGAEAALERPIRLNDLRLEAVTAALLESGAKRVVDLGCGEGRLLKRLLKEKVFTELVGIDASTRSLEHAAGRLKLDRQPSHQRDRVRLLQGALTYKDSRLDAFDAAALVEVIEHLDPDRLSALERVVFAEARPKAVVVTTPNREYNALFEGMAEGQLRHADHRFEWSRAEFEAWAGAVARRQGYDLTLSGIGEVDPQLGAPTQMALFRR